MKYLIIILLILSFTDAKSETKDMNIYSTFLGYAGNIELVMEYKLYNTKMFGIESTTYFKYGASMFGFYDVVVSYSTPIIGFVQYFGDKDGLDLGANYYRRNYLDLLDKSLPRELRVPSKIEYDAVGLEIGYRFYEGNNVYRFTYTPSLILESNEDEINSFIHFIGFSIGISL